MLDDRYCILVVDDVRVDREILRYFLEKEGYDVSIARDGLEGLAMLETQTFDLVLLDVVMPRMYGNTVLKRIRANPRLRDTPVLMMTAIDAIGSVAQCINLGAEDYLTKPHNKTLLKARISNCIQKKKLRDQEKLFLKRLEEENRKSERLLRRILPKKISDRLKSGQRVIVDYFAEVTVMFCDIVGYTRMSTCLPEEETIQLLHKIYSRFDELSLKYGLEKIKTIGDSYMVVGGIPEPFNHHAAAIADMALDMREALKHYRTSNGMSLFMRFGINTGPVRVGIIGTRKFSYDLWGDTVNIASRMESHGIQDQIQATAATRKFLRDKYVFQKRKEKVNVKGKGPMTTYFLSGRKEKIAAFDDMRQVAHYRL